MAQLTAQVIGRAVAKAPTCIKQELSSTDPALRERAEESLAAIIAAALAKVEVMEVQTD